MSAAPDDRVLAELLPGRWRFLASNYPSWFLEERVDPVVEYRVDTMNPLVIADEIRFHNEAGEAIERTGTNAWTGAGFVRRGAGLRRFMRTRWSVIGASEDGTVIACRSEDSQSSPAAINLLLREASEAREHRAMVAHDTERFGLTPEEFGSLRWL